MHSFCSNARRGHLPLGGGQAEGGPLWPRHAGPHVGVSGGTGPRAARAAPPSSSPAIVWRAAASMGQVEEGPGCFLAEAAEAGAGAALRDRFQGIARLYGPAALGRLSGCAAGGGVRVAATLRMQPSVGMEWNDFVCQWQIKSRSRLSRVFRNLSNFFPPGAVGIILQIPDIF